ncbi:MAG TPA: competence protein CoiA family protein [Rhabdochlamydiaceae bacterium]|nr:competence protein CoiA family protein [Rhabdochlamydiaceae bacterium]
MQLYALSQKSLILASQAEKGKDYLCPECSSILRIRGGKERQLHFFHLKANDSCKQHQKGLIHLKLQLHLQTLLSEENPQLEFHFPEISRIADVACLKSKRIFEIQYSPISLEEAQNRTKDYESLGFRLIWILHDHQFNKRKVSAAEAFLRTKTCYFTDFDKEGRGSAYDQFEILRGNRRVFRSPPFKVDLKNLLQHPLEKGQFYCKGALPDRLFRNGMQQVKRINKPSLLQKLQRSYSSLLHLLLRGVSE